MLSIIPRHAAKSQHFRPLIAASRDDDGTIAWGRFALKREDGPVRYQAVLLFLRGRPDLARRHGWHRRRSRRRQESRNEEAQLRELLTQYGPIEYLWFDHVVGDGGLSHAETIAWCKSLQPGCFVGFSHGDQQGADIRLGELGRPGLLADPAGAGPYMKDVPSRSCRLAEFTYPILRPHQGGAMWFYSLPIPDALSPSRREALLRLPRHRTVRQHLLPRRWPGLRGAVARGGRADAPRGRRDDSQPGTRSGGRRHGRAGWFVIECHP